MLRPPIAENILPARCCSYYREICRHGYILHDDGRGVVYKIRPENRADNTGDRRRRDAGVGRGECVSHGRSPQPGVHAAAMDGLVELSRNANSGHSVERAVNAA